MPKRPPSCAPRWHRLAPAVIITTTAFAAGGEPGAPTPLDDADVPVLQAVIATTRRAAWAESPRGLGAADLAMHVVLPELDGRVLAGAIAFKASAAGRTRGSPSRRLPTGRSPIASRWWRSASPRWCDCAQRRAMSAASRS